jgi:ATP-dependent Clp protease ATP-binding subunit ClpX
MVQQGSTRRCLETQVEDNLAVWVQRLRDRGVGWARIGAALGMARQSAW